MLHCVSLGSSPSSKDDVDTNSNDIPMVRVPSIPSKPSIEIPSSDEEEENDNDDGKDDRKEKSTTTQLDAVVEAAEDKVNNIVARNGARIPNAMSTAASSLSTNNNAAASAGAVATAVLQDDTEQRRRLEQTISPSTTIDIDNNNNNPESTSTYSTKKRRRKRSRGRSPTTAAAASTSLLSSSSPPSSSNVNNLQLSVSSSPAASHGKNKQTMQKKSSSIGVKVFRNKPSSSVRLSSTGGGSGTSDDVFAFHDETYSKKTQSPSKRRKLSKKSQEEASSLRNGRKEDSSSSATDFPAESTTTDSSSEAMEGGSDEDNNSSQQEEEEEEEKESVDGNEDVEEEESDKDNKIEFKLPRSLAPFNTPGVQDYGIIRTSRLRDRSKKTKDPVDIEYQHIKGQVQCHATKEGRVWSSGRNKDRCKNCAEGAYNFCHSHRHLDENQKLYWKKREKAYPRSTPGPAKKKDLSASKSNRMSAPAAKMNNQNRKFKPSPKARKKGVVRDKNGYESNSVRQCVFLKSTNNVRCGRVFKEGGYGFCKCHANSVERKGTESYREDPGTMRCTAVTKKGRLCSYKALDKCVFCLEHIDSPPEKVSPIVFSTESTKDVGLMADTDSSDRESEPCLNSNSNSVVVKDPLSNKMKSINNAATTIDTETLREDIESRKDTESNIKHPDHKKGPSSDNNSEMGPVSKRSVSAGQDVGAIDTFENHIEESATIEPKAKDNNPPKDSSLRNDLNQANKDIEMESVVQQVDRSHQEEEDNNPAKDPSLQNDLNLTNNDIEMESVEQQIEKTDGCNPPGNIIVERRSHQEEETPYVGTLCDEDDVSNAESAPAAAQVEKAFSNDERCFYVHKSKQCSYKVVEGDVVCSLCKKCVDEKKPFDHISDDYDRSLNRCFRVDRCTGKQCSGLATAGEVMCSKCRRSCGKMKESLFETCEDSDLSVEGSSKESTSSSATESSEETNSYSSEDTTDDDYDSDESDESDVDYDSYCSAYTHNEFFKLWRDWEKKTEKTDEVEDSQLIRRANNNMDPDDTKGQQKAQYGRVLPQAMKKMIQILELRREDIFLDIGHGIGNTCLHASFCAGCDSRGIEVVSDRHDIADRFRGAMIAEHNGSELPSKPDIGNVDLRLGRLEDPKNKEFLTVGVTRAYVNNFNGVFAERSSKNGDKYFLDNYIAGIFASMAPGSIMVTFHPLSVGLDRDEANSHRKRHNMNESDYASFYSYEKILLGKACRTVKWNQRSGNTHDIFVFKYKRLHQPLRDSAAFLCCNPKCKNANDEIPIAATRINEDGRCVMNYCECKHSPRELRKR